MVQYYVPPDHAHEAKMRGRVGSTAQLLRRSVFAVTSAAVPALAATACEDPSASREEPTHWTPAEALRSDSQWLWSINGVELRRDRTGIVRFITSDGEISAERPPQVPPEAYANRWCRSRSSRASADPSTTKQILAIIGVIDGRRLPRSNAELWLLQPNDDTAIRHGFD